MKISVNIKKKNNVYIYTYIYIYWANYTAGQTLKAEAHPENACIADMQGMNKKQFCLLITLLQHGTSPREPHTTAISNMSQSMT